ncbi:MAG: hypothetical protein IPM04_14295 [Saprospiraceae bacterium]|nr:hypothetical protein [Candidatus Brachybacter algidus]MBK8748956.1 hypothetical protein [Candidatus Brachybacter algidus]
MSQTIRSDCAKVIAWFLKILLSVIRAFYILHLTNELGCDSIVNLTVSGLNYTEIDLEVTIVQQIVYS